MLPELLSPPLSEHAPPSRDRQKESSRTRYPQPIAVEEECGSSIKHHCLQCLPCTGPLSARPREKILKSPRREHSPRSRLSRSDRRYRNLQYLFLWSCLVDERAIHDVVRKLQVH